MKAIWTRSKPTEQETAACSNRGRTSLMQQNVQVANVSQPLHLGWGKRLLSFRVIMQKILVNNDATDRPFGPAVVLLSLSGCIRAHPIFLVGTEVWHTYSDSYLLML